MAGISLNSSDYMIHSGDIRPAFKKTAINKDMEIPKFGVNNSNDTKSFAEMLSESVQKVEDLQRKADKSMVDLATGKTKNIHETMIAVNKAEIAYQLMTQIRNKAVEAYKEIMRMNV